MLLLAANSIKQDKAKPSGIVPILAIFFTILPWQFTQAPGC